MSASNTHSKSRNIKELRTNPMTSNAGKKWSREEDTELMNLARTSGNCLENIAVIHRRTVGAVRCRIMYNVIQLMTSYKLSYDDIHDYIDTVGISVDDVKEYKERIEMKRAKNNDKHVDEISSSRSNSENREITNNNDNNNYNIGVKWTSEEEDTLLREIQSNLSLEKIASNHKRSVSGIVHRLRHLGACLVENGMSISDACEKVRISYSELERKVKTQNSINNKRMNIVNNEECVHDNNIDRRNNSELIMHQILHGNTNVNNNTYLEVLCEIRDLLRVIADKK